MIRPRHTPACPSALPSDCTLHGARIAEEKVLRTITPQCYSQIRPQILELDVIRKVDNVFPLWLGLDEHLRLPHELDDLSDVAARLLEQLELLAQEADAGVQVVALRLEPPEVLRLQVGRVLGALDLRFEEVLYT